MTYDLNITFDDNLVTGNNTIDYTAQRTDRPYPKFRSSLSEW